jgi:hypothetical protein
MMGAPLTTRGLLAFIRGRARPGPKKPVEQLAPTSATGLTTPSSVELKAMTPVEISRLLHHYDGMAGNEALPAATRNEYASGAAIVRQTVASMGVILP